MIHKPKCKLLSVSKLFQYKRGHKQVKHKQRESLTIFGRKGEEGQSAEPSFCVMVTYWKYYPLFLFSRWLSEKALNVPKRRILVKTLIDDNIFICRDEPLARRLFPGKSICHRTKKSNSDSNSAHGFNGIPLPTAAKRGSLVRWAMRARYMSKSLLLLFHHNAWFYAKHRSL